MDTPDINELDLGDPDQVHGYMEAFGPHDWPYVADIGNSLAARLWNIEQEVESDSPIDNVNAAIAAAAAESVFAAVALCLDVDPRVLSLAVAPWYESFDYGSGPPPPLSPFEFFCALQRAKDELRQYREARVKAGAHDGITPGHPASDE